MSSRDLCQVCGEPSDLKCSACKLVFYCSPEHQQEDWKRHKDACRPFEIYSSDTLGRFLKATRDLQPGQTIFCEYPLVAGPHPHGSREEGFPCVGCCKLLLKVPVERCKGCSWPICSSDCKGVTLANCHGFECNVLQLRPPPVELENILEYYRFDVLIILRALYLRRTVPKKWDQLISLEDHHELRSPGTEAYKIIEEKANFLRETYLNPLERYEKETGQAVLGEVPQDLIHKIFAIFDVNATELTRNFDAMVLYPTASLIEHNCIPNTIQSIDDGDKFRITFRAATEIPADEHITSMYTHILWGTSARKEHLKRTKYFTCTCERCRDPTELGTYLNALKCIGSENNPCGGTQLPIDPTAEYSTWRCDKCRITLPEQDVVKFVNHLSDEVDKVMARIPKAIELEDLMNKLSNFLHQNHYLMYRIKHSLVQLYGREDESVVPDTLLQIKVQMTEELIWITKKIDPGNARLSIYLSVLLNEKFLANFKLLSNKSNEGDKATCKELLGVLEEMSNALVFEQDSSEGRGLLKVLNDNTTMFRNWLSENNLEISK